MKTLSKSQLASLALTSPAKQVTIRFHRSEARSEYILDEQDISVETRQAEKIISLFETHSNLYVSLVLTSNE